MAPESEIVHDAFKISLKNLPKGTTALLQSFTYALASALAAILFLTLTNVLFQVTFVNFSHLSLALFLVTSFITIMITSSFRVS
jgi:uncharacterized protein YciW